MIKFFLGSVLFIFFLSFYASAQVTKDESNFTLSGVVVDATNKSPLFLVSVATKGSGNGIQTDNKGKYEFTVPSGKINVVAEYIGYKLLDTTIFVSKNTTLNLQLKPSVQMLKDVKISTAKLEQKAIATQSLTVIQGAALDRTRGLSLGDALKSITGVTTFQTGPSISKPIIHGLTGNRVLIMNNGVRLEAQQWGAEHAPEIDPFIANKLEVVKGAAGIRYGSDAMAGVILVKPKALPTKTNTINGEVNAVGMSNSYLGAFSGMLEGALGKKLTGFSYRLQGSLKRAGNTRTPDYLLGNTGLSEDDFSAAAQYYHKNFGVESFYSNFHTQLGILAGTEVGSIADLQMRLNESKPQFPVNFSYKIDRPYQLANHATFKLRGFYNFNDGTKLEAQFATQSNKRSEYNLLSFSPNNDPALFLNVKSTTADINYTHKQFGGFSGSLGVSGLHQGNIRKFGYLIPNFVDYDGGAYLLEKYRHQKLLLEAGIRYDYRWLRAFKFNENIAKIEAETTNYHSSSATLGAAYDLTDNLKISANYGSAFRAPTVNELYSNGVHQTLISYEVGNPNLQTERANNFSLDLNYASHCVQFALEAYNNSINNFIFLQPSGQYIRVQSGSLLRFNYTQANVYFRGIDFNLTINPVDSLDFNSKSSLIYAYNKTQKDYLIYTPPGRFQNGLTYHFGDIGPLKTFQLGAEYIYVAKQNKVPAGQDYAAPPPAYGLVNAHLAFKLNIGRTVGDIDFSANNLADKAYRDYLDRFRYFADEAGRNFILRLKIPFNIKS
ncbi:TonB-dependent receptor [Pedobacter sp. UYP30]|uniref:TonB-dependent receptor n=1 Tax=Pedobacter sp. UYP30 TaxID=1756400 RepID=UPI00339B07D0